MIEFNCEEKLFPIHKKNASQWMLYRNGKKNTFTDILMDNEIRILYTYNDLYYKMF